jgi:hypothetical protein
MTIERQKITRLAPLIMISVLMACSPPAIETATTTTAPTPADTLTQTTPLVSPSPSLVAFPTPDLAQRPQIWFGPLDPSPPDANRPYSGRLDFFRLFTDDATWKNAAGGTNVFKFYGGWLDRNATNAELEPVIADLKRRGMGIAFEGGPLTPTTLCTGVIEGFAGPVEGSSAARKIKQAGGTVDYVDLEHPYDAVTFANGPQVCRYSPEQAAQDVSRYVRAIREIFPDARFGAVETAENDLTHVRRWVEAYRSVMGENLDYFNFDLNYYQPNWAQQARAIEDYLHKQGIEFGMFYRGDEIDSTGEEWLAKAEERFVEYEVIAGGRPDRAIFQSWHPQPEHLLPETDPGAFTYLIDRYLRTRTGLSLQPQAKGENGMRFMGNLSDADGRPLPGALIELTLTPVEGPGLIYEYTVSGMVPPGSVEADVGYRVNTECDCSGPSEFTLYEIRYTEGDQDTNQVPNADFSRRLDGWGTWGEASAALVPSDRGEGYALQVEAQPGEVVAINSARFATAAGTPFTATFTARVSPKSAGSGYFDLIFLDATQELRRFMIPLEPVSISLGQATSGPAGEFEVGMDNAPSSTSSIEAWFGGNDVYWPAYTRTVQAGE